MVFFFSSRRRHTRCGRDWSSDVCSSDLRIETPSSPYSNVAARHSFETRCSPQTGTDWLGIITSTFFGVAGMAGSPIPARPECTLLQTQRKPDPHIRRQHVNKYLHSATSLSFHILAPFRCLRNPR